jgi:membrane-bound serine protease (ClpP class)
MRSDRGSSRLSRWSIAALLLFLSLPLPGRASLVDVITVDGAITPVTAKIIGDAVKRAERSGADALVIKLDTPGGLMEATWKIDKTLLAARVPVVVYITPSGGRAASAGVYISYAAHAVAMSPSTHIGAAHPVTMGGRDSSKTMTEKITNDAVAHIKGLADKRGRNAAWAEDAVRNSVSITEKEALQKSVINLVAADLGELLNALDGRRVNVDGEEKIMHTRDATIREFGQSWRYRLLDKISDPNIAYIFMMLGIWGLYFELANPGSIFPGVVGGIFLILAFFSFQVLSINAAGLALIFLSVAFFIVEVKVNSHGLLAAGGVISMFLGSIMLFNSPDVHVSLSLILAFVLVSSAFFFLIFRMAYLAHRRKPVTGRRGLMGEFGEALSDIDPAGKVSIHGEIWKAVSAEKIGKGEKVGVIGVEGMVLRVESTHDHPVRKKKNR